MTADLVARLRHCASGMRVDGLRIEAADYIRALEAERDTAAAVVGMQVEALQAAVTVLREQIAALEAEAVAANEVLNRARRYAHAIGLFQGGHEMDSYVAIVDMLHRDDEQDDEDRRLLTIGAWVQANLRWHQFRPWPLDDGYPYPPCPTACSNCGLPEHLHPWATLQRGLYWAGYDHQLNTLLAAGDAEAEL